MTRTSHIGRTVLLLFLLFLIGFPLGARGDLSDRRKELEEIEQRIRDVAQSLDTKQGEVHNAADQLEKIEGAMGRLRQRMDRLKTELDRLKGEEERKQEEIEKKASVIADSEAMVERRLIAMYKTGEVGMLRTLLLEESPARAAEGYDFLARVIRRDRELLATFRADVQALQKAKAEQRALLEQRENALNSLESERSSLRKASQIKGKLLARLKREEGTLDARLNDLRKKAERLTDLVKKLESEKPRQYTSALGPFSKQKGHLPWPLSGKIIVRFGTSRNPDSGNLRESQGIEIAARAGDPVSAIWSGKVIFADWFKGYGNLLILDHGEGYYSLYAQAQRIARKVGEKVKKGDTLGYAGLAETEGIYFEIRHHGIPLDPADWLGTR